MKKSDFWKEVEGLSEDELKKKSRDMAEELMKLRFRNASGQLDRGHLLTELKRNYARVQTLLTAKRKAA